MALREEKGGGTRAPAPRLTGHPTQRRKPSTTVTKQPRSKVLSGNGSVNRTRTRTTNPSQGAAQRRYSSSSNRGGPSSPPSGSSRVVTPAAPPVPVVPNNAAYLKSDSTYQRQMAAYAKALADFQADQGLARTDYETGYQGTYRDIGLAKEEAAENLKNDFASRGMLQSSLYNEGLGELNNQYQNQYTDLGKQRTSFLDQLSQEFAKYKNEQGTQQQNAQQEALRRRQEKYNL